MSLPLCPSVQVKINSTVPAESVALPVLIWPFLVCPPWMLVIVIDLPVCLSVAFTFIAVDDLLGSEFLKVTAITAPDLSGGQLVTADWLTTQNTSFCALDLASCCCWS